VSHLMRVLAKTLATGFFSGFSPKAPGTIGSLVVLAAYWLAPPLGGIGFGVLLLVLFPLGVASSTVAEAHYGRDASVIVIDEMFGMLLTLFALEKNLTIAVAGFLLFRFFDIVKLFPIDTLQKLPKGWGIMMDDVVAGIYSNLLLRVLMLVKGF